MKKFALLLSFVFAAGLAIAAEQSQSETKPQPAKAQASEKATSQPSGKTHEVAAEIVSVDAAGKTLTIKGEKDNKTVPVDEKAQAAAKALKAGQKVTLLCRDNEKGEHQAIAGIKADAAAKAPEKK